MFVFLLPLTFISLFLSSYFYLKSDSYVFPPSVRHVFLISTTLWMALLILITEILSVLNHLTFGSVLFVWFFIVLALGGCIGKYLLKGEKWTRDVDQIKHALFSSRTVIVIVSAVVVYLSITAIIAYVAPTNNWDSMTYHMSRVMHWMQNQSLASYPTNILRQIAINPGAEYVILHLQLLSGSDQWANFVQWFSLVGCVVAGSLIAQHLKLDAKGQALTALLTVTIPMAIVQASSTQNDLAISFWTLLSVYFVLQLRRQFSLWNVKLFSLAIAIGFLVKGSGLLLSLPPLIYFLYLLIKKYRTLGMRSIVIFLATLLIVIGPFAVRTFKEKAAAELKKTANVVNEAMTPALFVANVVKNAGLHLGTSWEGANQFWQNRIEDVHHTLGVELNDARINFGGSSIEVQRSLHEDMAGNALHFWLIVLTLLWGIYYIRKNKHPTFMVLFAFCVINMIIFNGVLKWQPWQSRLQLPLFMAVMPLTAFVIDKLIPRKIWPIIVCVFAFGSLPWLVTNKSRPLIGEKNIFELSRKAQYFTNRPNFGILYDRATQVTQKLGCKDIGLSMEEDGWEYPFWVFHHALSDRSYRFEHVEVKNLSQHFAYPRGSFEPCAIISFRDGETRPGVIWNQRPYPRVWGLGPMTVFGRP